jgi:glycosyltransferase involved in cell wall biosynthesis
MTIDPVISVIVSTYNRNHAVDSCPNLFKRAIDSILSQTFKNFELILINDASEDGTHELCLNYAEQDPRVKYYHFEQNSKLPALRYNQGMSYAKGQYFTFMFDDDLWKPIALETLYNAMAKNPACGMMYALVDYIHTLDESYSQYAFGGEWSWKKLKKANFIANNAVILKREVIDILGGYDEDPVIRRLCDWDLWWRISRKFQVKRIGTVIGSVFQSLPGSLIQRFDLNWNEVCVRMLDFDRPLPLKKAKNPLRCSLHASWFDFYFWQDAQMDRIKEMYDNLIDCSQENLTKANQNIKVGSIRFFYSFLRALKKILGESLYLRLRKFVKK